jgi:Rrf2 family transcriptional regulator, nitric oxide-sensitive transcriptional repressor
MHLTLFTDYSLRTLIYLGLHGDRLAAIADIADRFGIKQNHLTKVVHRLGQLGLVETVRGRHGGVRLARPPSDIPLGTLVRQTEENLAVVECFVAGPCRLVGACKLECVLRDALGAFLDVLDRYTLADLLAHEPEAMAARLHLPLLAQRALAPPPRSAAAAS